MSAEIRSENVRARLRPAAIERTGGPVWQDADVPDTRDREARWYQRARAACAAHGLPAHDAVLYGRPIAWTLVWRLPRLVREEVEGRIRLLGLGVVLDAADANRYVVFTSRGEPGGPGTDLMGMSSLTSAAGALSAYASPLAADATLDAAELALGHAAAVWGEDPLVVTDAKLRAGIARVETTGAF